MLKFVDDTKVIKGVKTEDDVEDFQTTLDKLYTWQVDNNMSFNASKFQLLRLGPNEDLKFDMVLFSNDMK